MTPQCSESSAAGETSAGDALRAEAARWPFDMFRIACKAVRGSLLTAADGYTGPAAEALRAEAGQYREGFTLRCEVHQYLLDHAALYAADVKGARWHTPDCVPCALARQHTGETSGETSDDDADGDWERMQDEGGFPAWI